MIVFHYTYYVMALGFVLTGYYLNLIVFTSLIIVHELGHYITARVFNFKVEKIIIYPYGGMTKLNDFINKNINHEILIAISGVLVQSIYFLVIVIFYRYGYIREYTLNLYREYHIQMLIFNLLPIYPLDGAKIVNLLLSKVVNYDISNKLTIVISIITILIILGLNIYRYNYSNIMVLTILIHYLFLFYRKLKYLYYKFLLERYLYHITYDKICMIRNGEKLYKDRSHIIKKGSYYIKENDYLKEYFRGG